MDLVWNNSVGDHEWGNPLNWTPASVPDTGDGVTLPAGIDAPQSWNVSPQSIILAYLDASNLTGDYLGLDSNGASFTYQLGVATGGVLTLGVRGGSDNSQWWGYATQAVCTFNGNTVNAGYVGAHAVFNGSSYNGFYNSLDDPDFYSPGSTGTYPTFWDFSTDISGLDTGDYPIFNDHSVFSDGALLADAESGDYTHSGDPLTAVNPTFNDNSQCFGGNFNYGQNPIPGDVFWNSSTVMAASVAGILYCGPGANSGTSGFYQNRIVTRDYDPGVGNVKAGHSYGPSGNQLVGTLASGGPGGGATSSTGIFAQGVEYA